MKKTSIVLYHFGIWENWNAYNMCYMYSKHVELCIQQIKNLQNNRNTNSENSYSNYGVY